MEERKRKRQEDMIQCPEAEVGRRCLAASVIKEHPREEDCPAASVIKERPREEAEQQVGWKN